MTKRRQQLVDDPRRSTLIPSKAVRVTDASITVDAHLLSGAGLARMLVKASGNPDQLRYLYLRNCHTVFHHILDGWIAEAGTHALMVVDRTDPRVVYPGDPDVEDRDQSPVAILAINPDSAGRPTDAAALSTTIAAAIVNTHLDYPSAALESGEIWLPDPLDAAHPIRRYRWPAPEDAKAWAAHHLDPDHACADINGTDEETDGCWQISAERTPGPLGRHLQRVLHAGEPQEGRSFTGGYAVGAGVFWALVLENEPDQSNVGFAATHTDVSVWHDNDGHVGPSNFGHVDTDTSEGAALCISYGTTYVNGVEYIYDPTLPADSIHECYAVNNHSTRREHARPVLQVPFGLYASLKHTAVCVPERHPHQHSEAVLHDPSVVETLAVLLLADRSLAEADCFDELVHTYHNLRCNGAGVLNAHQALPALI